MTKSRGPAARRGLARGLTLLGLSVALVFGSVVTSIIVATPSALADPEGISPSLPTCADGTTQVVDGVFSCLWTSSYVLLSLTSNSVPEGGSITAYAQSPLPECGSPATGPFVDCWAGLPGWNGGSCMTPPSGPIINLPLGETACYEGDLTSAVDTSVGLFEASSTVITSSPPPPGVSILAMGQLDQPSGSPVAYEWTATTESEFTIGTVVAPDPTAAFTNQQDASGGPLDYDFDGSTSMAFGGNTITSYSWDFGDGSTATGVTPTHLFSTGGTYEVTLTVTDSAGNVGSITQSVATPAPPVVNSTGDAPAANPASGNCDTGNTVTNSSATQVPECTLRAAIEATNAMNDGEAITFDLPPGVTPTISPAAPLDDLTAAGTTIDASTVSGGFLTIDGSALNSSTGIGLEVSGANDIIQGFDIENVNTGIQVDSTGGGDTVVGNVVGLNSNTSSTPVGTGVLVLNSPHNTVGGDDTAERNVISNTSVGVGIKGTASTGNNVQGNYLGTDLTGGSWAGDTEPVYIYDASDNLVGGPTSTPGQAPGNVIDGYSTLNGDLAPTTGTAGVAIGGITNGANNNVVQGNIIGLLSGGTALPPPLGSSSSFWNEDPSGVAVIGRASGNTIGGTAAGDGNVISGNINSQIQINGTLVTNTTVAGNLIGTDITGTRVESDALGTPTGIVVAGSTNTTIGIAGAGKNVITGQTTGVYVRTNSDVSYGPGTTTQLPGSGLTSLVPTSTTISGNIVGPLADGKSTPTAADNYGVVLDGNGDTLGANNEISYNGVGVQIGTTTTPAVNETIDGNGIGTDNLGTTALPNGEGVSLVNGTGTRIGLPGAKANTISGNLENLVLASAATVQNNLIGTTSLGNAAIAPYAGIPSSVISAGATYGAGTQAPSSVALVTVGPSGSLIGGTQPGTGNVISGSPAADGLDLYGPSTVQGNNIGVGVDGKTAVPNAGYGILAATGAAGSTIGASPTNGAPTTSGPWAASPPGGNIIANNGQSGVGDGGDPSSTLSDVFYGNGQGGIITAPPTNGPALVAANLTGAGGTVVLVAVPHATPNTIVQIYSAVECNSGVPEGQTLLQTVTTSTSGTLLAIVALQAVGTPLVATLTTNTDGTAATDNTSSFSECTLVDPESGSVSPSTVTPGQVVTATVPGFSPGALVDVSLHSDPIDLGGFTADAEGDVTLTFTVPADLPPGPHDLVFTALDSGQMAGLGFTVTSPSTAPATFDGKGYWEVGADGGVFSFGNAAFNGSEVGKQLNQPIVGIAATPDGKGYWEVGADGGVFAFGSAAFYGSEGGRHLDQPIVGIAATPDGKGYWEVGADGGVFAFGSAAFYGSEGGRHLDQPIVGIAATPDGKGYWEVGADGGVFAFGNAAFDGSEVGTQLDQPIVGIAATPDGQGYWEVGADGGVFAFGSAVFDGSEGGKPIDQPIVGIVATPDGRGYWEFAADGGVFAFGSAVFEGSEGGKPLNARIVAASS